MDRKTLRKYIAPAAAAGIAPGRRAKGREDWAEVVRGWFLELTFVIWQRLAGAAPRELGGGRPAGPVRFQAIWQLA